MASTCTAKALVKNRLSRTRHGSTKSNNNRTFRRNPSPDSAYEHDTEWMMGPVSGPEEVTSDLSEEGEKSCGMETRNTSASDTPAERSSDNTSPKIAAGQDRQDSDVDSGIVACRKVGERIGSTSSADTDSSQESRPGKEYTPILHKNELTKSRSYTGSLRVPRRSSCLSSSGPVKGDHLVLKECNRRPPTPLSVFPDSHHCVRFDEQLQLSEQNIRRSCRKLFATLYTQRFSYPTHQENTLLHGRSNSVHSRIRSKTVPELDLRRYNPVDVQLRNVRNHTIPEVCHEESRPPSSAWNRRAIQKSMSDVCIDERASGTSPVLRYKPQYQKFPMDLPEDKQACYTASTDSGLGSLRNSSQCTCHSHNAAVIPSSQPSNISTCTCRCCSCHQELQTNANSTSKLFKSSSCSTLSSNLSHQSRPQLTQFPPRTLRKVVSHSEDRSKNKYLQKTSSCSNLLDKPANGYHVANVPVYNDNMVQAYARIASVIPDDLKSNCSSHSIRRAKTLSRLKYKTDNVFVEPYRPRSSFSSTPEPSQCLRKKDCQSHVNKETIFLQPPANRENLTFQSSVNRETIQSQSSVNRETIQSQSSVNRENLTFLPSVYRENSQSQPSVNGENFLSHLSVNRENIQSQPSVNKENITFQHSADKDNILFNPSGNNTQKNASFNSFNSNLTSREGDRKSIVSAEIYSQINDDVTTSFEKTPHRESMKHLTCANERPKNIGVVIPNRGPNPVYLKSALKKPTQSAIINVNELTDLETQVKGIANQPSEVEYAMVDKTKKNRFASLPALNGNNNTQNTVDNEDKDPPVPPKKNLHKSDFSLYRSRSSSPKKTILERMQALTKNAKSALQKAFSTERIYRPEREERMEGQKGLQRSKSFIRGLAGSFRKKKRKNRESSTTVVVPQTSSNSEWNDQSTFHNSELNVLGQLLQLNLDGSQVVELTKPPTKPYGFFVARGRVRNSKGVFVSRMRDQETQKQLAGLLDIGDEILEIDGYNVKDADIMEVNRLMSNNTLLLTVLPYICRKDI